jgi:acetyl-CoA carboxylase biotin carboxyl carrier protein
VSRKSKRTRNLPAAPAKKRSAANLVVDPALVRELADILRDANLNEIEIERGELRLRLARAPHDAQQIVHYAPQQTRVLEHVPAPPAHHGAPPPAPAAEAPRAAIQGEAVRSPMVGTAYLSPDPGSPPFVKVGDTVTEGQTLMVVEAMKTFNPIPAPRAGKVSAVLVADAQPVEFGEPLVVLE